MNRAVCATTWREFRANKVRIIMMTLLMLGPIVVFTLQRCNVPESLNQDLMSPSFMACIFTLLWGVGVIGREVQHGTIALVLARPITIADYVFSKWFSVGLAASLCAVQAVWIDHIISSVNCPTLLFQPEVFYNGLERVFLCFGTAAFLCFTSAFASGLKDLALLGGFGFCLLLAQAAESILNSMAFSWISPYRDTMGDAAKIFSSALIELFYPYVPVSLFMAGNFSAIGSLISYFTVITCCLSLAIWSLNRKEFSYAAD
jgi:hypothetical protein